MGLSLAGILNYHNYQGIMYQSQIVIWQTISSNKGLYQSSLLKTLLAGFVNRSTQYVVTAFSINVACSLLRTLLC